MAEVEKQILKFRQSKGNNSFITDDTLVKLRVHNHNMVLYIQYTFHEIPFIGYLVMADHENTSGNTGWKDGRTTPNLYPSPLAGDNNNITRGHMGH